MEQLNRVELRGNVGFVRLQVVNEKKVMHLSLATNYVYKGRNGEPVIETTWHNITAWEGKGMPDFTRIEKGSKLHLIGRVRCQRYTDNDGIERVVYDVAANQMNLIEDPTPFQYEF